MFKQYVKRYAPKIKKILDKHNLMLENSNDKIVISTLSHNTEDQNFKKAKITSSPKNAVAKDFYPNFFIGKPVPSLGL
jgi:hypothetical protein